MTPATEYKEKKGKTSSLALLRRLEKKFTIEATEKEPFIFNNITEQAAWYTGFHPNFLKQIRHSSYKLNEINFNIDRCHIHKTLMYYYLCKNTFLTPWQAFNDLRPKLPPYMDIYEFKKLLIRHYYTFRKIGKQRVIIEDPFIYFERYRYLKNIQNARKENKPLFFITEFAFVNDNFLTVKESIDLRKKQPQIVQKLYRMAVSTNDIIISHVQNFEPETFEKWLTKMVRNSNEYSVIVIDGEEHHGRQIRAVPDINSLKYEMMEWLDIYDVYYDQEMTKCQLFDLIEKFTMDTMMYRVDEIANLQHQLLRLPDCISGLSVSHLALEMIELNYPQLPEDTTIKSIAINISQDCIKGFHKYIKAEEDEMLDFDIKFDDKYDELVQKERTYDRNELPDTSSSDSD